MDKCVFHCCNSCSKSVMSVHICSNFEYSCNRDLFALSVISMFNLYICS